MYSFVRSLLFFLEPEHAHQLALSFLNIAPISRKQVEDPIEIMGLKFPNRIGLAAGFDKNGTYLHALQKLGFGFIEVGTVTPKPQAGNPKPRLFRLPKAKALINRMGFNNEGVDTLITNVQQSNYQGILGINIGKNKDTSLNHALEDYSYCLQKSYSHASYITINISSPNTPDLRALQHQDYFSDLMNHLREEQLELAEIHQRYVPLMVKLSPDETAETLKQMADVIVHLGIDGIIATNTTCKRDAVESLPHGHESGGLSGKPLTKRATNCLQVLKEMVGDEVVLIGVGGIDDHQSASQKFDAGASLVQLYTGLIYQGPALVRQLAEHAKIYFGEIGE